jgi:DNA-binding transcriptional MerR regulator
MSTQKANGTTLLISEVAKAVGLHPETLRRLERRGFISSRRDINGWRRYDPDTVEKISSLYAANQGEKP